MADLLCYKSTLGQFVQSGWHRAAASAGRDPVVFAIFIVILVTVLAQGLTLRPLIRRIGLPREAAKDETLRFSEARVKVNVASLEALETIVDPGDGALAHPASKVRVIPVFVTGRRTPDEGLLHQIRILCSLFAK